MDTAIPADRITAVNDRQVNPGGAYVLYWMTASRRTRWSFPLQRAAQHARELGRPLVILEALRCGYPHASDRLHAFMLQGMADNHRRLVRSRALYHPYVEPEPGAGRGLLACLGEQACVVVTDEYPTFFLPRMIRAAARQLPVLLEAVDGNGILPLRASPRSFPTAHGFRRHLQKNLLRHLDRVPLERPLARLSVPRLGELPEPVLRRWPAASPDLLAAAPAALVGVPIDHGVGRVSATGGALAAQRRWSRFLTGGIEAYHSDRNQLDMSGTSGLSPYLHFGHISAHQLVLDVLAAGGWVRESLSPRATGSRSGWWGLAPGQEAFLDQVITWRELGFNGCFFGPEQVEYETLPAWARATLEQHAADPRPHLYSPDQLEAAETHDELWNAAQRQLLREGTIHNYLRMLWGKKILHWSNGPRRALRTMVQLNDRYALDGRDPNSRSGILWTLGRYDRAWGPERPVFGKVRYMSSKNTRRKLKVQAYLRRYGP